MLPCYQKFGWFMSRMWKMRTQFDYQFYWYFCVFVKIIYSRDSSILWKRKKFFHKISIKPRRLFIEIHRLAGSERYPNSRNTKLKNEWKDYYLVRITHISIDSLFPLSLSLFLILPWFHIGQKVKFEVHFPTGKTTISKLWEFFVSQLEKIFDRSIEIRYVTRFLVIQLNEFDISFYGNDRIFVPRWIIYISCWKKTHWLDNHDLTLSVDPRIQRFSDLSLIFIRPSRFCLLASLRIL